MHGGMPSRKVAPSSRYTLSGTPTTSANRVENVPSDCQPREPERLEVERLRELAIHAVAHAPHRDDRLAIEALRRRIAAHAARVRRGCGWRREWSTGGS